MFLGAMAYMIYAASPTEQPPMLAAAPSLTDAAQPTPALTRLLDAEHWKRSINPDYVPDAECALADPSDGMAMKVVVDSAGQGDPAQCGDTIQLQLTVWNANTGARAFQETFPLTLGARSLAAGLDVGLLGIRPHESRSIILPPYALARRNDSLVSAAVRKALPEKRLAIVNVTRQP